MGCPAPCTVRLGFISRHACRIAWHGSDVDSYILQCKQEEPAKEAEGEEGKKEGSEEEKGRSSKKRNRGSGGNNSGASIDSLAEAAVKKLSAVEPKLELAGQQLQFLAHREQVCCRSQHPTPMDFKDL